MLLSHLVGKGSTVLKLSHVIHFIYGIPPSETDVKLFFFFFSWVCIIVDCQNFQGVASQAQFWFLAGMHLKDPRSLVPCHYNFFPLPHNMNNVLLCMFPAIT